MVRSSRMRLANVLLAVALVGLLGGCVGGRRVVVDPCDPCPPCDPCAQQTDPCEGPPCDLDTVGPGEAWCRVWVPPSYATQVETVCVKPASCRKVMIPARYGTRPKLVCESEPKLCEKITPATWAVKTREREVCPPRDCWKRICCPQGDLGPCEIQCECWTKVRRPGVYCEEPCPVCLTPERRCVEYTPAQYRVEEERYLIEPARCETVRIPAQFEQRCKQVCVKPGHWEWRRNEACEVPQGCLTPPPQPCAPAPPPGPEPLPALQVEMKDNGPQGEEAGQFSVGDLVRYDLDILSDEGSQALDGLTVTFMLPPELEFVSGDGDGVTITGSGQSAASSAFDLGVGAKRSMYVLCKVLSVSPTNLVQLSASVRGSDGMELAVETESTTLKP